MVGVIKLRVFIKDILYTNSKIDGLVWYINHTPKDDNLIFDFSLLKFLRPEIVILLVTASKMWYDKSGRPVRWKNLQSGPTGYLNRINISVVEYVQVDNNPIAMLAGHLKEPQAMQALIPLQVIQDPTHLANVIKDAGAKLEEWFPERAETSFSSDIQLMISEIAGNSLEHSIRGLNGQQPICYFTAQRYCPEKKYPKVIIVIGDLGIGFNGSLNMNRRSLWKDDEAICKALFNGESSRELGGGLGLKTVSAKLKNYGGHITIRSGAGSVHYIPQRNVKEIHSHRYRLIGTQTSLLL